MTKVIKCELSLYIALTLYSYYQNLILQHSECCWCLSTATKHHFHISPIITLTLNYVKGVRRVHDMSAVLTSACMKLSIFRYSNDLHVQLNPGNSNCQGKMKLLQVIGVSSYRGFEQKDQKHLIKVVLCLYMFFFARFLAM